MSPSGETVLNTLDRISSKFEDVGSGDPHFCKRNEMFPVLVLTTIQVLATIEMDPKRNRAPRGSCWLVITGLDGIPWLSKFSRMSPGPCKTRKKTKEY